MLTKKLQMRYPTGNNDPYWSSVALLLHFNGTNGGTTFTDSSPRPKTLALQGTSPTTSTAQIKYGSASGLFVLGAITVASHTDMDMGTGDYTFEYWMQTNGTQTNTSVIFEGGCEHTNGATTGGSPNKLRIWGILDSGATDTGLTNDQAWHHVAVTRVSAVTYVFIDGVQTNTGASTAAINFCTAGSPLGGGNTFLIGRYFNGASDNVYRGYLDDLRITKGVGRYTSNFTPPTAQYPDS